MLYIYNTKVKLQIGGGLYRRSRLRNHLYKIVAAEPQNICSNIVAKFLQVQRTEILYMLSGHKLRFYFSQYNERQNYTHTNLFNLCPVEVYSIYAQSKYI